MSVIEPDTQWNTRERLLNNKVERAVPVQVPRSEPGKRVFREKDQLFFLLPGIVNLNAEDPLPDRLAHADQNCAKSACVMSETISGRCPPAPLIEDKPKTMRAKEDAGESALRVVAHPHSQNDRDRKGPKNPRSLLHSFRHHLLISSPAIAKG